MIRFELQNTLIAGWITFHQTKDLLEKLVSRTFADLPVTNEEYKVLLAVKNHPGPASQVDVARWLSRSPNTVSVLLARMEKEGLLVRARDTADQRVVRVDLTPKGEQVYWEASVVVWRMVSGALGALTEDERETLITLLTKMQGQSNKLLGNGSEQLSSVTLDDAGQLALLREYSARASKTQEVSGGGLQPATAS